MTNLDRLLYLHPAWRQTNFLPLHPPCMELSVADGPPVNTELPDLHPSQRAFVVPPEFMSLNLIVHTFIEISSLAIVMSKRNGRGANGGIRGSWGCVRSFPLRRQRFPRWGDKSWWGLRSCSSALDEHVEEGLRHIELCKKQSEE